MTITFSCTERSVYALNAHETKDFLCSVDAHGQHTMIACQCRELEPIILFDTYHKRERERELRLRVVTILNTYRHNNKQKWAKMKMNYDLAQSWASISDAACDFFWMKKKTIDLPESDSSFRMGIDRN